MPSWEYSKEGRRNRRLHKKDSSERGTRKSLERGGK